MQRLPDIPSACNRTAGPGPTGNVSPAGLSGIIRIALLLLWAAGTALPAAGQGIKDSVFTISEVAVTRTTTFLKEQAGMKRVTVDTLILRHQVHADLSTLLAENSNIYIRDYGRGALATASFRGTAPSHTQVTWNGLSINSPMLGMVDFSLVPVFIIDELNIHHGAASVESRSGGLGGHIEIRSLPDWSNRTGGRIYTEYGSFNTAGGMAQFNLGGPKFQSATRLYSSGSENNYPFVNKNIIEKDSATGELSHPLPDNRNAAYRKSGISQEFYFRNTGRAVISNKTWVQAADRSVPTVLSSEYLAGGLQRDNLQTDRTVKNVTEYNFYGEQSKIRLRSGLDYQRLDYTMETEVPGLHRQKNVDSQSRMFSWLNSGALSHSFSERFSADARTAFNRYGIATYDSATHTGYDTVRLEGSLFGGLYLSATEQLMLSLQLRKDFVSDYRSPLIYTFGLSFRPLEKHDLVLRTNIARNYHHPTLNDMYWQPGGNPGLLPEEGFTGEVSVLWAAAAEGRSANTSLTGYYARINDWILWLPGFKGYWEPVNLAEVRSYGLEYELSLRVKLRQTEIRLHGNFALTHTRDYSGTVADGAVADGTVADGTVAGGLAGSGNGTLADGAGGSAAGNRADDGPRGEQLPFIPKVSGNAFVSVTNRGWYLTWQYNAMGVRSLMTGGNSGPADDSDLLPGLKGAGQLSGSAELLPGSTRDNQLQSPAGIGQLSGSQKADQLAGSAGTSRLYSLYPLFMNNLRIGKGFEVGSGKGFNYGSGKGFEVGSGKNDTRIPLQKIIVELRIDNLFNETYRNELQRFMPGRAYTLNVKFEF